MSTVKRRSLRLLALLALGLFACQPSAALSLPAPVSTPTPYIFSSLYGQTLATYTPTAAAAQPATPAATISTAFAGQTLHLHLFCARSGPLSASSAWRAGALEAALQQYNAAGGLQGAQLQFDLIDTGDATQPEPSAAAAAQQAATDQPAPLALLCDAASEELLIQWLTQRNLPALGPGVAAQARGVLYGLEPPPAQALAHWLRFMQAPRRAEDSRSLSSPLRLAIVSWPASLAGEVLTPQLEQFAEELDVPIVQTVELSPRADLNVYDWIYTARDLNVNLLYVNADSYGLAAVLNALGHLGLQGRFAVAAPSLAYEPALYEYLADPAFAEGLYLVSALPLKPVGEGQAPAELGLVQASFAQASLATLTGALEHALAAAGSPAAITPAQVAAGLQAAGYPDGQRSPAQLALWQVGATPGDLRQLDTLRAPASLVP
ncbi:MAG: ABC transporter substrate-binding protein [Anaerolineales bacterium]|nr:ABC transporter substrate-binding protein [Anaerolineales bacterium]